MGYLFSPSLTQSLLFLLPPALRPPAPLCVYLYICQSVFLLLSAFFCLFIVPITHPDPGSSLSVSVYLPVSISLSPCVPLSPFLSLSLPMFTLVSDRPAVPRSSPWQDLPEHFLAAHGPSSCYQLEMNQIRKRGSGGVIARYTRGSQLISGGPGFERKCSCDTEPFLPSLSCRWRGGGGYGHEVGERRGRGQRARPQPLPGMCTPICARSCLCTYMHTPMEPCGPCTFPPRPSLAPHPSTAFAQARPCPGHCCS